MIHPDDNIQNADWTKKTFDLIGLERKEDLVEWLKRTGTSFEDFKKLPVYQAWKELKWDKSQSKDD